VVAASDARIGVLASGVGTILGAIFDAGLPVAVVVVDRLCRATEVAEDHGVPAELLRRTSFGADFDRAAYTGLVVDVLRRHRIDLVVMAGFGTILASAIHDAYGGRILNTHPALLPAFPGWHPVEDALAAGVAVTGCTVHVATLEVDSGPILTQEAVPVESGDTVETLHARIKAVEQRIYPAAIARFLEDLPARPSAEVEATP